MSDVSTHLNELEAQFAGALAAYGDWGLLLGIFPLSDAPPTGGPLVLESGSIPTECLPRTTWARLLGWSVLADLSGAQHPLLYVLAGTGASEHGPVATFLNLARRAGALCFRLARGSAAAGVGNALELDWLNTVYAHLKGTPQVVEGAGYSRIPNVFAASTLVLGALRHAEADGPGTPLAQCLCPGGPDQPGEGPVVRVRAMTREECLAATTPPDEVREWLAQRYRNCPVAESEGAPSRECMAFERLALFTEFLGSAGHPVDDIADCVYAGWAYIARDRP